MRPAYWTHLHGNACGDGFASLWREIVVDRDGADLYWLLHIEPDWTTNGVRGPRANRHWINFPMLRAFQEADLCQRVLYCGPMVEDFPDRQACINDLAKMTYADGRDIQPLPAKYDSPAAADVRTELRLRFRHLSKSTGKYTCVHAASVAMDPRKIVTTELIVARCLELGHPVVFVGGAFDVEQTEKAARAVEAAGLPFVDATLTPYRDSLETVYNAAACIGCESCWALTSGFLGIPTQQYCWNGMAFEHLTRYLGNYSNYKPVMLDSQPTPEPEPEPVSVAMPEKVSITGPNCKATIARSVSTIAQRFCGKLRFLELGTAWGGTAKWTLEFLDSIGRSDVEFYAIDMGHFDSNPVVDPRYKFIKGFTCYPRCWASVPDDLHYIFVDACHCISCVQVDAILYSQKLIRGGHILFHDASQHYPHDGNQDYEMTRDIHRAEDAMRGVAVKEALLSLNMDRRGFTLLEMPGDLPQDRPGIAVYRRDSLTSLIKSDYQ